MINDTLALVKWFLENPAQAVYARELAYKLNQQERSVYNRLRQLAQAGILTKENKNYRLNAQLAQIFFNNYKKSILK